jgi:Holliday junction resolvase RusA-like endonuclease
VSPVPASRPRVTRWGVYYGKKYTTWKKFMEENLPRGILDAEQDLLVVVTHIIQKPRTSKLSIPNGDIDNYDKAALDAVTHAKGYWKDDRQIEILLGWKRFAESDEIPRTILEIYSP